MLYKQDTVCFTKKFRTLDPHPSTVKEKVLNKTVFLDPFPYTNTWKVVLAPAGFLQNCWIKQFKELFLTKLD